MSESTLADLRIQLARICREIDRATANAGQCYVLVLVDPRVGFVTGANIDPMESAPELMRMAADALEGDVTAGTTVKNTDLEN